MAVRELAASDRDLGGIVDRFGPPPMWDRPAGFATLVHIVLEQQVSLASAQAAFDRLAEWLDELTPERFLTLGDSQLLAIGFSRQKARYVRDLAKAVSSGGIDLEGLAELSDADARRALESLTGVGPW
jgi:DNA-3-methyladenine glycosylase II